MIRILLGKKKQQNYQGTYLRFYPRNNLLKLESPNVAWLLILLAKNSKNIAQTVSRFNKPEILHADKYPKL